MSEHLVVTREVGAGQFYLGRQAGKLGLFRTYVLAYQELPFIHGRS